MAALAEANVDPGRLTLEFSENGMMRNTGIASQILLEIDETGRMLDAG